MYNSRLARCKFKEYLPLHCTASDKLVLFKDICRTGIWPSDFMQSILIPLKKSRATACRDTELSSSSYLLPRLCNRSPQQRYRPRKKRRAIGPGVITMNLLHYEVGEITGDST